MFHDLFSKTQNDTIILTANNRLARRIHFENTPHQLNCLPLTSWLKKYWSGNQITGKLSAKILLTTQQENILWQNIIKSNQPNELLHLQSTAQETKTARRLLNEWEITLNDKRLIETQDSLCALKWMNEFDCECTKNNFIDQTSLISILTNAFQKKLIPIPRHIILVGFINFPPALSRLFDILKQNQCLIEHFQQNTQNQTIYQQSFVDTKNEIKAMAKWAKNILDSNNNCFIGCVVPELSNQRHLINRIFNEVFFDHQTKPFNISLGENFLNEPMIYTALEILRLGYDQFLINDLSYLLRSPYFAFHENEKLNYAEINFKLYALGNTSYHKKTLLDIFKSFTNNSQLQILMALEQLNKINLDGFKSTTHWVDIFNQILNIFNWPAKNNFSNTEHQIYKRWLKLLNEFTSLEIITQKINFRTAVTYLKQLASKTIFQPSNNHEAPIQILGILEATGLPFSDLWIMGLDDHHWPMPPQPNALLPIQLQRQLNMPHCSAQREFEFSQQMMGQLLAYPSNIMLSYPAHQGDETLQPSACLKPYQTKDLHIDSQPIDINREFDVFSDKTAPLFQTTTPLKGGSSVLKDQSNCPFLAFAKARLYAKQIESVSDGIMPKERGTLLHKSMELIWQNIKSLESLLQTSSEDLNAIITLSIEKALQSTLRSTRAISSHFIQLEKYQLQKIIMEWLQLEMKRESFKVIGFEQTCQTTIGPLTFSLRIDRVDQFSDQTYALIDYKTGTIDTNDWYGKRPADPQIPLYLFAFNQLDQTSAIAFANIRANKMNFKGISVQENILPNLKTESIENWQQQIDEWKNTLNHLATQFYQGHAEVDPIDPNKTCRNCPMKTLCRIHELSEQ